MGGTACPACGSQIRVDLAEQDDDSSLPTEVPGLDEAVASWKDLEGITDVPEDSAKDPVDESPKDRLPFGFSGASNTHVSRLPFGIGSSAVGMPFDGESDDGDPLPLVSAIEPIEPFAPASVPSAEASSQPTPLPSPMPETSPAPVPTPAPSPIAEPAFTLPPLPEPVTALPVASAIPTPLPVTAPAPSPAPAPLTTPSQTPLPVPVASPLPADLPRLEAAKSTAPVMPRLDAITAQPTPTAQTLPSPVAMDTTEDENGVPEMWRIDAAPPNMEQIYAESDQVVEVVHSMDVEPTLYAHEPNDPDPPSLGGVISLDIHPAQALAVSLDGLPEFESTLQQGFQALGTESWAQAAIAFQKLAARMPGDAAVFNNYGLSLLQRALTMAKSSDLELQTLATTQFESAILALREAAKSAPTEGVILLNLAHALLVSGRAEKAIGLIQMHDQTQPQTPVSGNLHAAALVSMGESGAAKSLLQRLAQDSIIRANLERLSY